jgi:hypothetical protein
MTEPVPDVLASPYQEPTRLGFVLRVVGGCVVVAIIVGIGLWARGLGDDEFALPDRLAGRNALDTDAALQHLPEGEREEIREEVRESARTFTEQLSDDHDGAEAAFRSYGVLDEQGALEGGTLNAQAVRDGSDPLVATPNPPGMPESAASEELVEDGEVSCLVLQPPARPKPFMVTCQRTDDELTVLVFGTEGAEVDTLVDAVNEVWEDLS